MMWILMLIVVAVGALLTCYINDKTGEDYGIEMGAVVVLIISLIIHLN